MGYVTRFAGNQVGIGDTQTLKFGIQGRYHRDYFLCQECSHVFV